MKMKPEDTIDFNIRSTWHKIARMYNVQAAEHGVSMATGMVLLNIDLKEGTYGMKECIGNHSTATLKVNNHGEGFISLQLEPLATSALVLTLPH